MRKPCGICTDESSVADATRTKHDKRLNHRNFCEQHEQLFNYVRWIWYSRTGTSTGAAALVRNLHRLGIDSKDQLARAREPMRLVHLVHEPRTITVSGEDPLTLSRAIDTMLLHADQSRRMDA